MKGIIFYYSNSGNTRLASQYIAKSLRNIDVELIDMVGAKTLPDLTHYEIVGFSCWADFLGPSYLVKKFIEQLPQQEGKLSFLFSTYGNISGRTLRTFSKWVTARGFNVVSGFSLKTPQTHVPHTVKGKGSEDQPDEAIMEKFREFIRELDEIAAAHANGGKIKSKGLRARRLTIPTLSRTRARKDMGDKFVDESLCKECGRCEKGCPYNAITMAPKPTFDMEKCYGCWKCYHHCQNKAIYTSKFRGVGHYPQPNSHMKAVLSTK